MSALVIIFICFNVAFGYPCMDFVSYGSDGCEERAILTVPDDFSGLYLLQANISVPFAPNKAVTPSVLIQKKEEHDPLEPNIVYALEFPTCVREMRVISVVFNGKLLCIEEPTVSHEVTILSVRNQHTSERPLPTRKVRIRRQAYNPYINNPFLSNANKANKNLFEQIVSSGNNLNQRNGNFQEKLLASTRSFQNKFSKALENPFATNPFLNKNFIFESPEAKRLCGVTNKEHVNLIHGGQLAKSGDFPWVAAMFYRQGANKTDRYICTGNQVSETHVITAAHCTFLQEHRMYVVPGIIRLDDVSPDNVYEVRSISRHPDYRSRRPDHDLAVITVKRQIQGIPVCLWNGDMSLSTVVGSRGTVIGWGSPANGVETSPSLKMVDLPIVSQEMCFFSDVRFRHVVTDNTFCAGDRNMKGPCTGDSGGGFHLMVDGLLYLRGVVSTALASRSNRCDLSSYVIFSDVAKEEDWVQRVLNL